MDFTVAPQTPLPAVDWTWRLAAFLGLRAAHVLAAQLALGGALLALAASVARTQARPRLARRLPGLVLAALTLGGLAGVTAPRPETSSASWLAPAAVLALAAASWLCGRTSCQTQRPGPRRGAALAGLAIFLAGAALLHEPGAATRLLHFTLAPSWPAGEPWRILAAPVALPLARLAFYLLGALAAAALAEALLLRRDSPGATSLADPRRARLTRCFGWTTLVQATLGLRLLAEAEPERARAVLGGSALATAALLVVLAAVVSCFAAGLRGRLRLALAAFFALVASSAAVRTTLFPELAAPGWLDKVSGWPEHTALALAIATPLAAWGLARIVAARAAGPGAGDSPMVPQSLIGKGWSRLRVGLASRRRSK